MSNSETKNKRMMIVIIVLLALITAVCVTTTVIVLVNNNNEPPTVLTPDYAPKDEDPNAENIPNDSGGKLEQPEGGGAVSLIYTTNVTIDLSEKKASLMFGNAQRSNQDMVVQIVVRDCVIVQSGRITPGKRVTALDLLRDAPMLGEGTYTDASCRFVVLYYDRQSGEKAILNTEIPITVTVKE